MYEGAVRRGFGVTLASPALRDQWWFANGEKGPGVRERYSIYNPTEDDVEVTVVPLGIPLTDELVTIEPIPVAARQVVTFSPDDVADLPAGRHAMVFSTGNRQSIVVEQAFTAHHRRSPDHGGPARGAAAPGRRLRRRDVERRHRAGRADH